MDRLDSMEAFVRVAESKSFSEAARRLNLSKSVISRQVSGLEADLGARLFHRTTFVRCCEHVALQKTAILAGALD